MTENPNPYNLKVGQQYWFQYTGCKSDWFNGIVTRFTKFGHPWVMGAGHSGIISPGLYKVHEIPNEVKMIPLPEVKRLILEYKNLPYLNEKGFDEWFEKNVDKS